MPSDLRAIKQRGTLVVSVLERDCAPFVVKDAKGERGGLNIELLQGFARALGLKLEYDTCTRTYDEMVERVARGQADLAACRVCRTLRRVQFVSFSRPYLKLRQGLLINRLELADQGHGDTWQEVLEPRNRSWTAARVRAAWCLARHNEAE